MTDTGLSWSKTRSIWQFVITTVFFDAVIVFFSVKEWLGVFETPGSTTPIPCEVLVSSARCGDFEVASVRWWKRDLRILGDFQARGDSVDTAGSGGAFLDLSPFSLFRLVSVVGTEIGSHNVSVAEISHLTTLLDY